jgi:hypothetical protein
VTDTVLLATAPVRVDFAPVVQVDIEEWPGEPVLAIIDDRAAVLGRREGGQFEAQWSASPAFVAGAALAFARVRELA